MSLHVSKVKKASGDVTYRLRYWDNNQHKTVPADQHPKFKNEQEALSFCKQQNALADADRHLEKHAKGMDEIEWKKRYANFNKEVDDFIEWYQDEAPNSWESCKCWLQNYVIPYFLGKGLNNPNLWHTEYETFRKWLQKEATTMRGTKLSYATMNHIIKTLNRYIQYLGLHHKMDVGMSNIKCRGFKKELLARRGKEALIQPDEYAQLRLTLDTSREFFITLMNTGMRFMELYSLPFSNIFKGDKDLDETINQPYRQMGATIYGYIRLESQAKSKYAIRNPKTGAIARKALKSKKVIKSENNRVIPIIDAETWDICVENRRRAMKEWEGKTHTSSNPDDYLLFNVDINEIRRDLRKHTKKTPHCCRHTFTTNLVRSFRGVNYGPELCKGITGHTSAEFDRYVHLGFEDDYEGKKKKIEKF